MVKRKKLNWFNTYNIFVILFLLGLSIFFSFSFMLPKGHISLCWAKESPAFINAEAISNFGKYVAVGTNLGLLTVYDSDGKVILEKLFKEPILDLKFSYDESHIYVKTYSVYAVNIKKNSVSWEKFLKNNYVSDFFPFKDGNLGFIFTSKTDLSNLYIYTDYRGRNIKQFKLPEIYGTFKINASQNGKYLLFSDDEGNIFNLRYDGYVNWNTYLDPPVYKNLSNNYPILQEISNDGFSCISYTYEKFGKKGNILSFFDLNGQILWQKECKSRINGINFSPDSKKVSIIDSSGVRIYKIDGTILYKNNQYGYVPITSLVLPTSFLVGYSQTQDETYLTSRRGIIVQFFSLYSNKLLYQKRLNSKNDYFLVSSDGFYFFEISKPFLIRLYKYS